jgi:hypothetical protein
MKLFRVMFLLITLAMGTACTPSTLVPMGNESTVRDLASKFNTIDSLSRLIAFEEFDKRVSPNERAVVLAEIWEAAPEQTNVRLSVLAYLISGDQKQMPWNDRLEENVIAASTDANPEIRRLVLNVLIKRMTPDAQEQILFFLEDDDDSIREAAIIEIAQWDDSQSVLESYVKTNQGKEERLNSVRKAQFFLEKQKSRGAY